MEMLSNVFPSTETDLSWNDQWWELPGVWLYCVLKAKRTEVTRGDCNPVQINILFRQVLIIQSRHLSENEKFGRFNEVTEEIELKTYWLLFALATINIKRVILILRAFSAFRFLSSTTEMQKGKQQMPSTHQIAPTLPLLDWTERNMRGS